MKSTHIMVATVVLSLLLICAAVMPAVSNEFGSAASADISETENSDDRAEFEELVRNVKATDPTLLEKLSNEDYVLAVKGTIPSKKSGDETYRWFCLLDTVRKDVRDKNVLSAYMYPDGPIVGFGANADNYFAVALYADAFKITDEDIEKIGNLISEAAAGKGVADIPIVFEKGEPLKFDEPYNLYDEHYNELGIPKPSPEVKTYITADTPDGPVEFGIYGFLARYYPLDEKALLDLGLKTAGNYSDKYRPLVGGIQHSTHNGRQYAIGTIGFAARNRATNETGYVIAGHTAFWQTGLTSYQPNVTAADAAGTVSLQGSNTDAAFVPYANVSKKIHIGNGTLVNVSGGYAGGMPGMTLSFSGTTSGCVSGTYLGSSTNVTLNGHLMNDVERMSGACLDGDSGGPVYYYGYGKYKIVGIVSMSGTYNNGQPFVGYIPYGEISSKLNIEVL